MLEKMKSENELFVKSWEHIHTQGLKKYFCNKVLTVGIMMFFIYWINVLINKETSYLMVAIIYILITVGAPILAWFVNERRYRKYEERYKNESNNKK